MFSVSEWPWPCNQNSSLFFFLYFFSPNALKIQITISEKQLRLPLLPQSLPPLTSQDLSLRFKALKVTWRKLAGIYCLLELCVTDKGPTQTLICDSTLPFLRPNWELGYTLHPSCVNRPLHVNPIAKEIKLNFYWTLSRLSHNYFGRAQQGSHWIFHAESFISLSGS